MALSANTKRAYALDGDNEFGVAASATIYEGSAVGSSGGYARALNAGDQFLGFALGPVADTSGVAGTVSVRVRCRGKVQLAVTSVAVTDIGKPVYASDDGTFVLSAGTAEANSFIGTVHRFISTGVAIVAFDADGGSSITALTDSSTGTADGTVGDVGAAFNQANINNNFAEVTTTLNKIISILGRK